MIALFRRIACEQQQVNCQEALAVPCGVLGRFLTADCVLIDHRTFSNGWFGEEIAARLAPETLELIQWCDLRHLNSGGSFQSV